MHGPKLADSLQSALAEAGALVRAVMVLSGLALVMACVALIMALRSR